MAVRAYASLVSLTHVLDNVHYRTQCRRLHVDILKIETLQDRVHFLLDFVEAHSLLEGERIRDLWRQISEVAFEVEETFDSHVVKQLLCQFEGQQSSSDMILAFNADVDRLIQKFDFIKDGLSAVTIQGVDVLVQKLSLSAQPSGVSSHATALSRQDTLVGFDEHVVKVMDMLTSDESELQIIPIVGPGGIGKTALISHVYEKSYRVNQFDRRVWMTISQNYRVQTIAELLKDFNISSFDGRRYLIVIDGVWSTKLLRDDFMRNFPDNQNRSRIIIITRCLDVATCLGFQDPYLINSLNEDQSWNLLCQKIFSQDCCPHPELEDIGKEIAKSCQGLPLALVVIGRHLARSNITHEYWEFVRRDIYSYSNLEHDHYRCFKILSLSYNSLPLYLKPCLLYLRFVREDYGMGYSDLIRAWVDEGFIKQIGDKSQEDLAKEYIKDLIDRNFLFVGKRATLFGEVYSYGIHDLFRELCIRESDYEGFLSTPRIQRLRGGFKQRCYSLCAIIPSSTSKVSTRICDVCWEKHSTIRSSGIRSISFERKGNEYSKLFNPSIPSVLWNLHTLIIIDYYSIEGTCLPAEIWDMPQLRHLQVHGEVLPHPIVGHVEGNDIMIMKNLHTLEVRVSVAITKEVLVRIQNLKTLRLCCYNQFSGRECSDCSHLNDDGSLNNLAQLEKLQALTLRLCRVENINFPNSLVELFLCNLENPSERMTIIGLLPNLEDLWLDNIKNWIEWRPTKGQFQRLKSLYIGWCSLMYWITDDTVFPNLEWLRLLGCENLQEISLSIGDITTLRYIHVFSCSESTVEWAKQVWEKQQLYGNERLKIEVTDAHGKLHRLVDGE